MGNNDYSATFFFFCCFEANEFKLNNSGEAILKSNLLVRLNMSENVSTRATELQIRRLARHLKINSSNKIRILTFIVGIAVLCIYNRWSPFRDTLHIMGHLVSCVHRTFCISQVMSVTLKEHLYQLAHTLCDKYVMHALPKTHNPEGRLDVFVHILNIYFIS